MDASFTLGKGRKKRSRRPKNKKPAVKMSLKIKGSPGQVLKAVKKVAKHSGEIGHGFRARLPKQLS
jgi:hypothetical protein